AHLEAQAPRLRSWSAKPAGNEMTRATHAGETPALPGNKHRLHLFHQQPNAALNCAPTARSWSACAAGMNLPDCALTSLIKARSRLQASVVLPDWAASSITFSLASRLARMP